MSCHGDPGLDPKLDFWAPVCVHLLNQSAGGHAGKCFSRWLSLGIFSALSLHTHTQGHCSGRDKVLIFGVGKGRGVCRRSISSVQSSSELRDLGGRVCVPLSMALCTDRRSNKVSSLMEQPWLHMAGVDGHPVRMRWSCLSEREIMSSAHEEAEA